MEGMRVLRCAVDLLSRAESLDTPLSVLTRESFRSGSTSSNVTTPNDNESEGHIARRTSRTNKFIPRINANIKPPVIQIPTDDEQSHVSEIKKLFGISKDTDYFDHGDPTFICSYCRATLWRSESLTNNRKGRKTSYSLCCGQGKVELPPVPQPPQLILRLYQNRHSNSKNFMKYIRAYNNMFAFTSMGGKIDKSVNNGRGPYIFRLSGQNCHRTGSLLPNDGCSPKFSHGRAVDDNEQALDPTLILELKNILDVCNPLVISYRMARDGFAENPHQRLRLRLIGRRKTDGRTYNLPTVSEVAGLIVGDIDSSFEARDIIVETQTGQLQRISELHPSYLSLQYPMLFPLGQDGYRRGIKHRNVDNNATGHTGLTFREFFAYHIQDRLYTPSLMHLAKKLYQQFLVDAYTMIESERLSYIRFQQKKLRLTSAKDISNNVTEGNVVASKTGKRIILPSTFTGGSRYMMQNYLDAMAIVRHFGYPDLFITFTCNPKWPEIARFLNNKQLNPEDRPDILCRLFKIKLDSMIKDLKKEHVFGEMDSVLYTIEFQRCGLPHAHICTFLKAAYKLPTSQRIDSIISAEIPDRSTDPDLYQLVANFMMHGPCGTQNPKSPCMNETTKTCTKLFPKSFQEHTSIDENGYPIYRRRDNGSRIYKGDVVLHNGYVVPYNPFLLKKYQSHINVERCNQTGAIKYLFKFINKGPNRITAGLVMNNDINGEVDEKPVDEIKEYYDCRYISACEAAWRIFGNEIHYRTHAVERLSFHLPNEQPVIFEDDADLQDVIEKPSVASSMFTSWMEIKGPTCFEDIRTVNGKMCPTFKDACYELGLLDDDKEYVEAFQQASQYSSGSYLRSLFVMLLVSNNLSRPDDVWSQCSHLLGEDILHKQRKRPGFAVYTVEQKDIDNHALYEIELLLRNQGSSLKKFQGMPYPSSDFVIDTTNILIHDELRYDRIALRSEHDILFSSLTSEQKGVYEVIVSAVNNNVGGVFFVYGYGGTGKTFLWKTVSTAIRSKGKIVLNVASSGIASLLLNGGRTAHSRFVIPINITEDSFCSINVNSQLADLLRETSLIIWDEAPMIHKHCFEALDRTLRDIMRQMSLENEHKVFGGKVVVFGGDFRQILPVVPKGSRQDIVNASLNSSYLWDHIKVLKLTVNMRLQSGTNTEEMAGMDAFANWILDVGNGTVGGPNDGEAEITIPDEFLIKQTDDPIGEEITYLSFDDVDACDNSMTCDHGMRSPEFLNSLKFSGIPNHKLVLKVGVPIMLLKNIDQTNGLCNGTRLMVIKLEKSVITARVITGTNIGFETLISRMKLSPTNKTLPFKITRKQFPVSICFAMTINKSQGQSLSHVGLFLPRPVFTHGQLYVAISRVKNKKGLKILICDKDMNVSNTTTNVVYKEVLQSL
ncbi:uncharacterized protein [Rutidosis leptorrhynchoides]|uniref:uncharacterized protein n=1 Tax=Rutidosis leptorrhynchoides TaxID=125765 RepID=UPI003A9A3766